MMSLPSLNFVRLCCFCFFIFILANSQRIPEQDWDYVEVRDGAFMFWWLYGASSGVREELPLVMWLQGGPGASGVGYGNFEEIGPYDIYGNYRNTTWLQSANLLFVDNPVGTGYSYVVDQSLLTRSEEEIARDLVTMMKAFLKVHPNFSNQPFWIFCESYGGKMTSSFAKALNSAIQDGTIDCDFRGVALGDSWIEPMDFVNTWGEYLYKVAEINQLGLDNVNYWAAQTQAAVDHEQWKNATNLWTVTQAAVEKESALVDWYNILDRGQAQDQKNKNNNKNNNKEDFRKYVGDWKFTSEWVKQKVLSKYQEDPLTTYMNGPMRDYFGIIPDDVIWSDQSWIVFETLAVDFMQSVVSTVDELIDSGISVNLYTGNLDLVCCTIGTVRWMNRLKWNGLSNLWASHRTPLRVDGIIVGFKQEYQNVRLYTILDAGHMVPSDQGEAALLMVNEILFQTPSRN